MSESKATPGPWRKRINGAGRIVIEGGRAQVCQLLEGARGEADAALIASAPDLLTACKALLAKLDVTHTRLLDRGIDITEQVRAAVARAEGG
jgi:hypothetical protein